MKTTFLPFLLGCTFTLVVGGCTNPDVSPKPQPQNIIFLLTDDQRWDALGAAGNPYIQTPEMDRLAEEGTLFKHAYVTTPICAVSRASILSGQYARRHGIHGFATDFTPIQWANSYPELLRNAGYFTGFIGKFGVGRNLPDTTFNYWRGIPGQPQYEHTDEQGTYKHLTRMLAEQSLEFLDQVPNGQNFCLSISFKAPHVQDRDPRQFLYDSAYIDMFQEVEMPGPINGTDSVFQTFPDFFTQENEARLRWEMRFATEELYQHSIKGYYRLIYGVDVTLGAIRKKLEEKGLAENTVIVLMGDNGFFLGERGLAGKWYAYDESIHVPLLIYDPELPQARRGQQLEPIALNIDLAPTFLSWANLPPPDSMQGKNLRPLLKGEVPKWREDFLFEHLFDHPKIPKSEGVVSLKEKYFVYPEVEPVHEEYYNLAEDARETQNLISSDSYESKVESQRERLEELRHASK
ncbi:MAG: sulfatase [Bacteroidota bacterium]